MLSLAREKGEVRVDQGSELGALREVLAMALPIIVAMASNTLMYFADSWMVSRVGTNEIAAVGPAGAWVFVLISFLFGVVTCTSTFVGQGYGAGNYPDCARYAWQGIYVSLILGLPAVFLWQVAPAIFRAIGHGAEVQQREVIYFQIRLLSISAMAITAALASFFQAISRPRIAMVVVIFANVVNVVLNYILIYGKLGFPAMGIGGAAIATVIASWLQAAIMLAVFLSPAFNRKFSSRRSAGWDWHRIGRLFSIGLPAGVNFGLDVASWAVFTNLLIGRLGDIPLAASTIATQIMHLSFMPTVGLSIAITALVGQWIGRKDIPAAKRRTYVALKLGVGWMFVMGILFFLFRAKLIAVFRPDPEVVQIGSTILIVAAIFQIFDATGIVMSGALKGAGDTRWVAVVTVSYAWLIFLPASYLLAFKAGFGAAGAWVGAAAYIFSLAMTLLWRFHSERWRTIDVFGRAEITPYDLGPFPPSSAE